ncbi:MAG: HAD hydrolase family protein [Clostridia bacterium]|nr:HAD hydrolase family protein [Clostridia bacterium]
MTILFVGNGAIAYDLKNEKNIFNGCIPKEKALSIIKICDENNIYYTVNTEKYIISKKLKNNLVYYYYENSRKSEKRITNINLVENAEKYIKENDVGEVTKITISDEDKSVFNGIIRKLKEINGINILEVSNMSRKIIKSGTETVEMNYFYTEITKENINKWQTLKKLASYLNIDETEIVAIGDNINDMEMIQNAGLGIIIGESALAKKELNKIIVSSNDKNGVAEAIENHLLKS